MKIDATIVKVLKDFGKETLKEEQRTILMSMIDGRDCMAVLPTGFGKSLPYQMIVPVMRELGDGDFGKVVVISPLTALMQDQITTLNAVPNVTAICLGKNNCLHVRRK